MRLNGEIKLIQLPEKLQVVLMLGLFIGASKVEAAIDIAANEEKYKNLSNTEKNIRIFSKTLNF